MQITTIALTASCLAAAAALAGCADRGARGHGAYDVSGSAAAVPPPDRPARGHGVAAYRGYCEEHGPLIGTTADESDVDRVVAAHNAAYHRVAGSRFWVGEKIAVLGDDGAW